MGNVLMGDLDGKTERIAFDTHDIEQIITRYKASIVSGNDAQMDAVNTRCKELEQILNRHSKGEGDPTVGPIPEEAMEALENQIDILKEVEQ